MAILVEALTTIILCKSIIHKFEGGLEQFVKMLPNGSLRSDNELVGLTFMTPVDVESYIGTLVSNGLIFQQNNEVGDIAVVDQRTGLTRPCEWADFGAANWDNNPTQKISVCLLKGSTNSAIFVPDGWDYASSITANSEFVNEERAANNLTFLRHEDGVDVLIDPITKQEYFVKRN